jgi:hypothetical protein
MQGFKGMLIGLVGYAGAGKNAIADAMCWPTAAFADSLKEDVDGLQGLTDLDLFTGEKNDKALLRPLLVAYGEGMRAKEPNYWITRLTLPHEAKKAGRCVLTDVRYLNEARYVTEQGGLLFYVQRELVGPANDEERRSIGVIMSEIGPAIIENDTPEQAAHCILRAAEFHFNKDKAVA